MKKILIQSIAVLSLVLPYYTFASENNLSGKYACTGYDRIDGALSCHLSIVLDAKNSMLENGYSAYTIKMVAPSSMVVKDLPKNIAATGSIASSGNTFAMSFKNTNPKAPTDYGTAVGVVTHDQDNVGRSHTILHFFSYQSAYKNGDHSTWVCTKN